MLTLLLAFGGVFAVAAPAQAATNTIQGTITNPANTPGITVYLSQEMNTAHGRIFDTGMGASVTATDAAGHFAFTGVPIGAYFVLIDHGGNWVQDISLIDVDGVTDLGDPLIALQPGRSINGTVRDAASPFAGLPGVTVGAWGDLSGDFFVDWFTFDIDAGGGGGPSTPSSGAYSIVVPLDDTYEVSATDLNSEYGLQSWDHHNGCGCDYDPIDPGDSAGWPYATPVSPRDFDLYKVVDWIFFSVLTSNDTGTARANELVYLDKWDTGTSSWQPITSKATDSFGFVELFGPGDGDYRLRYFRSGVFDAVASWSDGGVGPFPLFDGGKSVELPGLLTACPCSSFFTEVDIDLEFANPTAGGGGGGGSSTPVVPRKPRTSTTSFTLPVALPTATPTPSATPTSTPSPSSSPTSEPSATPTPTPDPVPAQNPFDLWWLWLLLLLIVALIIFFLVRLIARR